MAKKYSIQIPETVRRFTRIYYTLKLWKSGKGNISLQQKFYFILFILFGLSAFVGIWTIDNIENSVFVTVVFLVVIVQTYRLYFVLWNQNEILDFMHKIGVDSTDDDQAFCNATNKINHLMTITKCYVVISYSLSAGCICLPLIKNELLFDIAFPWNYSISRTAYWMAYGFVAGAYFLSITLGMFISMIWYMMLIFVVKYDLLANEFANLGVARNEKKSGKDSKNAVKVQGEISSLSKNLTDSEGEQSSYVKALVEAIKKLEKINEQLEEFESRFSNLFLLQIFTSSMNVCGTTFVLAFMSHDDVFQYVFYTIEIMYCLTDIFAVLYFGNEIMLASDRLSYSLFDSNWIVQTQSCKKYMIVLVEYLKQPRQFIVGKLFALDLETFTLIVKRSFSMFNILRNFQN